VRRSVAIDETKQKVNGRQLFVWSAIDVDTKELLATYTSYQQYLRVSMDFSVRSMSFTFRV
jgi:transposase-like protein